MTPPRQYRRWLIPLLLLATWAGFLLPGLDRQVMKREQELRVALTARAMVDSGDWLHPNFLGEPRMRKPPLMYWLVASTYRLTGVTASAAVARLPSALAGLVLIGLLYATAAHMMGRRHAALAALVCSTSFIFIRQGRLAETDILLTLGVTAASLAIYHALRSRRSWSAWLTAGAATGLGFMAKGPAALVLPWLAGLAYSAVTPRARAGWRSWAPVGALIVAVALILPWYLLILNDRTALTQLRDEIHRVTTASEHQGPALYYTYTLLHAMAPWSLALPVALWQAWRHRRRPAVRFALIWLGTSFLALSLIRSKQIHYALLMLPPASLLVGNFLGTALTGHAPASRLARRGLVLFCWVGLTCGLLTAGIGWWTNWQGPKLLLGLLGLSAAALSALGTLPRCAPSGRLILFTAAWMLLSFGATSVVMPAQTDERIIREALHVAQPILAEARRVVFVGPRNAIATFYADRPLEVLDSPERAWSKIRSGDVLVVVARGLLAPPPALSVAPLVQRVGDRMRCDILVKP